MPDSPPDQLLVLHTIRVKGFVDEDGIVEATGLARSAVEGALADHATAGLVTHRDGRFAGWSLSPAGRESHRALLDADLDGSGQRPVLLGAYDRFLPINGDFKQVCTDWQLRPVPGGEPTPNDHGDETYDKGVIGRLEDIHGRLQEPLDALDEIARFARFRPRFDQALAKVQAGDTGAFARPLSNSYHDVWMELHEDLLVSLNRSRSGADGA